MPSIEFFYEDISFQLLNPELTRDWVQGVIEQEGHSLESLNYVFCSDEYLRKINLEYLNHDYYTDIVTFDNSEKKKLIEGDVFISIDRIQDNADSHSSPFLHELHRVIIHGVLHLTGYNDTSNDEKKVMREKENAYLSLLKF